MPEEVNRMPSLEILENYADGGGYYMYETILNLGCCPNLKEVGIYCASIAGVDVRQCTKLQKIHSSQHDGAHICDYILSKSQEEQAGLCTMEFKPGKYRASELDSARELSAEMKCVTVVLK